MTMTTSSSSTPKQRQYSYSLPNYDATGELPLHLIALPPLALPATSNDDDASKKEDGTPHAHVDMLAYGGNDGHIYLLPNFNYSSAGCNGGQVQSKSSSASISNSDNNKMIFSSAYPSSPILLTTYDDIPRTIAISPDGLRLAIGFDGGETRIFSYDDCLVVPSGDSEAMMGNVDKLGVRHHPFVDVGVVDRAIDRCLSGGGDDDEDR